MTKKTKPEREQDLHRLADTHQGCDEITELYKVAIGLPPGACAGVGTLVRGEMIPAILQHEYPNG
jgi:hypothetical protein